MRWGRRLEDGSVHSQAEASGQLGLDSEMSPTGYQYAYLGVVNLGRWRPQDISFEARSREFKSRRPHHIIGDIGSRWFCWVTRKSENRRVTLTWKSWCHCFVPRVCWWRISGEKRDWVLVFWKENTIRKTVCVPETCVTWHKKTMDFL